MVLGEVDFRGTERFVIRRRLGVGTFGVVYEAEDNERREVVALKALRVAEPTAIYRLKKEFRTLADVAHPNLVSLYELVGSDTTWFITMELVDGPDFLTYVRGAAGQISAQPRLMEERLRSALRQLASGVAALHRAGHLHRDLKPSNVLTTRSERVVILDFGISAELQQPFNPSKNTIEEKGIFGSPAYMAPEQFFDDPVTEATDWYAVGTMLYEALTGQLPFTGRLGQLMMDKDTKVPASPRSLWPDCPQDLAELALSLLERQPEKRATADEILRRVSAEAPTRVAFDTVERRKTQLIGRQRHLAVLTEAYAASCAGRPVTVYVRGPSGIGKSALVQSFLEDIERREGAVVLSGKCYVRESVPHKALDGIADSLARHLRALDPAALRAVMPGNVAPLLRTFPVLERVEALAAEDHPDPHPYDPIELRRAAFRALSGLLACLARARPLVLAIDDLQWADESSVRALEDLLGGPDAPNALLIVSFRSEEVASHPFLEAAVARGDAAATRQLVVDRLTRDETVALIGQLLPTGNGAMPANVIEQVQVESGGSPFLVEQLTRHLQAAGSSAMRGVSLTTMLDTRLAQLPSDARVFLATLAVAGRPLDEELVRDAAGMKEGTSALVLALGAAHLLRSGATAHQVELYHDRIREALASQISDDERRLVHLRLARTFERLRPDDSESLLEHFLGADHPTEAATHAARAARHAVRTLAFDRAALLYKRALELAPRGAPERGPIQAELAEALTNSGRMAEAARAFWVAAGLVEPVQALEYRRRAAEQFLMGGHSDEGLAVLAGVLQGVGLTMPSGPRHAVLLFLLLRLRLALRGFRYTERRTEDVPLEELRQIDICWAGSAGLGLTETIRAAYFQSLHMLLALRAGEPHRISRAFAVETSFTATGGGKARKRTALWRQRASDLAQRLADPQAVGRAGMTDGIAACLSGEWRRSAKLCEDAEQLLLQHPKGMMWELAAARNFWVSSTAYLGDVAALSRRVPVLLRDARERGNLYVSTQLRLRGIILWLARNQADEGRDEVDDAVAGWSKSSYFVQHLNGMNARLQVDLYSQDSEGAWRRLVEGWKPLTRSLLMRVQILRVESVFLRARTALVRMAQGREVAAMTREVERAARRLAHERTAWTDPIALQVKAALARLRGDDERARTQLSAAWRGFEACDMALFAAAAQWRLGELTGGTEGAALVKAANATFAAQSVVDPGRLTALLAPGFSTPS